MNYEIIYSKRKTLCLQVKQDGTVIVRAPFGAPRAKIEEFVLKHRDWVAKKVEIAKNKPKHIYIRCDGQETYDSAKQYSTTIVHNAIKAAYPNADVQYMNKNTFKIICIIITY
jgi:predicted metal-dependent hydrolase